MFKKIIITNARKERSEFQYFQKWGQNANLRKDMVRVAMFTKIGPEFQC